jgi:IS5 family transposase
MADRFPCLTRARTAILCIGAVALLATATPASAQWAWRDASGSVVFSDQAPPPTIPDSQIIRRPAGRAAPPAAPPAAPATAAPAASPAAAAAGNSAATKAVGPRTAAEQEQDFRKRQQERTDADKKQAEAQAATARREADCERARGYLRQLEDGMRIARTDAQGNREILDDAARSAEMQRTRDLISSTCK